MKIQFSKTAQKALEAMPSVIKQNIRERIYGLIKIPPEGDIQPIKGKPNLFRLRVGKNRVIYHYDNDILKIDEIGSRGDIYK